MTTTEMVWQKILAAVGHYQEQIFGRCGCIPVYDESEHTWRFFRNYVTIYTDAENCADPAKADRLRLNAKSLVDRYPETVGQLEKLGVQVGALLNRRIETYGDVVAWSTSVFNAGPIVVNAPQHVHDTVELAYDDFQVEVKSGRRPVYVVPESPRGAGNGATLDFAVPGSKTRYGPRHEYSRLAFARQMPKRKCGPRRPPGRPRLDGLVPGSRKAKAADRKKRRDLEKQRLAREAARAAKRD